MVNISVIIPSYNTSAAYLINLYQSLLDQTYSKFEVIIVDDCSQYDFYNLIKDHRFKIIRKEKNSGPASARNLGVENALSNHLFFTDSDCVLEKTTLHEVANNLNKYDIVVGNTITDIRSKFGKAVAFLGFPGGGSIGFDRVWTVDESGYTKSISSCNLAITKDALNYIGRFDDSIPIAGGEDTILAAQAIKKGYKIKYQPSQIVYHVEKTNWNDFARWQLTRGKGAFHIKRKLGSVDNILRMRLWSFKNSLQSSGFRYGAFVILLLFASLYYQWQGYVEEKEKHMNAE